MNSFFDEQGRTRVCGEAYMRYVAAGAVFKAAAANPRRTPLIEERAIYGWKLDYKHDPQVHNVRISRACLDKVFEFFKEGIGIIVG